MVKKNALGRGLSALIDTSPQIETKGSSTMGEILISQIEANPFQPRTFFDEEALIELSNSILEVGLIQPVTVRQISQDHYQLIVGERRLRASKLAGLDKIPAYISIAEDDKAMEWALIENIQREDLDAIEISLSYQRLIDEFGLTQEQLSKRVGKNRSSVANYLRLLKLPAVIQMGIRNRKIQMGHARALLSIAEEPKRQLSIYDKIVHEDLSVRKVEDLVKNKPLPTDHQALKESVDNKDYSDLKIQLSQMLGTQVDIFRKENGSGKITLNFKSDDELEQIIALLDSSSK